MTRVFISHSAKSEQDKRVLAEVVDDLEAAGHEIWWDREHLAPGTLWIDEIARALRWCEAAVVLFSQQALASAFVAAEVGYLGIRKRTEGRFGLFPLLIDDTAPETVKAQPFYGATRIDDVQFGRWRNAQVEWSEVGTAPLRELIAAAQPPLALPQTPNEKLELGLVETLKRIPDALLRAEVVDLLWAVSDQLRQPYAAAALFARKLLVLSLRAQADALLQIARLLEVHAGISALELFKLVAPAWIEEDAAREVFRLRAAGQPVRAALVNGAHAAFTAGMMLRRAYPSAAMPLDPDAAQEAETAATGIHTPTGRRPGDELVGQVRAQLLAWFGLTEADGEAELREELADIAGRPHARPITMLRVEPEDLGLVARVLDAYDEVALLVFAGANEPPIPPSLGARLERLEPRFRHGERAERHNEAYAFTRYARDKRRIERSA